MMDYAFWTEMALWLASALVFAAFFMKAILPLRAIAIASNIAFVAYGTAAENLPIFILHVALLPLNALRIFQHLKLIRTVRNALEHEPKIEKLIPFMTRYAIPSGTTVFKLGDRAETIYLLSEGTIEFTELGVSLGPQTIFGEVGPFLVDKSRTATAVCKTDCVVFALSEARLKEMVIKEPALGLFLTKLVAQRLNRNVLAARRHSDGN
ncbi:MAG: cyclic nucleotide-binding domain-containing protein [Pseudomonadota bacterium]